MIGSSFDCDLIIPALNEAANIDALFDALAPLRDSGTVRRVIVADNGSTDDTAARAAARGAIVVLEPQRGYGAACLKAIEWIAGEAASGEDRAPTAIVFLDADLSDAPASIPALIEPIAEGRAELVIGSRVKLADPGALNFAQRFGNALACVLMRLLTGRRYSDLGPFRAVRWSTLQRLNMQDRTWGWTVEMQMKAALIGIRTLEIDVPYQKRRSGRSKISGNFRGAIQAGCRIVTTVLRMWWRRRAIRSAAANP